ncbi:protein cueball [Onthophagus taurus]|uniref:protein cueball n=1 Tax=Onthophagus taurus TaxID=166361 RepID=UPI000C20F709|nr:protein cueball [Onthophagus taurus]
MWVLFALTTLLIASARSEAENHEWDLAVAIEGQIELLTSNGTLVGTTVAFTKLKALTFDNIRHQFIVSDMNEFNDTIYTISLTQEVTKNSPIIQNLADDIQGLAIDPLNDILYWSNPFNKTINYISLADPNDFGVFMTFVDESPQDLAIDSCRSYIYWTNSNLDKPTIDRAKLDGSGHEILIETDLNMPVGIAIDYVKKRLYWSDMGEGIYFKIESSDLEGNKRELMLQETHQKPFGLAVDEESVYWTDVNNNALWKIRKDNEEHPNKVRGFKEKPFGLIAKHLGFMGAPDCSKIEEAINEYNQSTQEIIKFINEEEQETLLQTVCLNNGELTEKNGCSCPKGFKGPNCEISLCYNYCVHGTCDLTLHGYPICLCNSGFNGNRCEYDLCHNHCLNGGKCSHNGLEPKCRCPDGYIGEQCEINVNVLALCTIYCANPMAANDFNKNITCNCEMQTRTSSEEYVDDKNRVQLTISDYLSNPPFLILCICMLIVSIIVVALVVLFQKAKKRRPRINKRIIVNKNVTPLTNRPQASIDQCEITIENCCNMNVCETPCFEPPQLRKAKKASDEKKNLLKNMETGDDLY